MVIYAQSSSVRTQGRGENNQKIQTGVPRRYYMLPFKPNCFLSRFLHLRLTPPQQLTHYFTHQRSLVISLAALKVPTIISIRPSFIFYINFCDIFIAIESFIHSSSVLNLQFQDGISTRICWGQLSPIAPRRSEYPGSSRRERCSLPAKSGPAQSSLWTF